MEVGFNYCSRPQSGSWNIVVGDRKIILLLFSGNLLSGKLRHDDTWRQRPRHKSSPQIPSSSSAAGSWMLLGVLLLFFPRLIFLGNSDSKSKSAWYKCCSQPFTKPVLRSCTDNIGLSTSLENSWHCCYPIGQEFWLHTSKTPLELVEAKEGMY